MYTFFPLFFPLFYLDIHQLNYDWDLMHGWRQLKWLALFIKRNSGAHETQLWRRAPPQKKPHQGILLIMHLCTIILIPLPATTESFRNAESWRNLHREDGQETMPIWRASSSFGQRTNIGIFHLSRSRNWHHLDPMFIFFIRFTSCHKNTFFHNDVHLIS